MCSHFLLNMTITTKRTLERIISLRMLNCLCAYWKNGWVNLKRFILMSFLLFGYFLNCSSKLYSALWFCKIWNFFIFAYLYICNFYFRYDRIARTSIDFSSSERALGRLILSSTEMGTASYASVDRVKVGNPFMFNALHYQLSAHTCTYKPLGNDFAYLIRFLH